MIKVVKIHRIIKLEAQSVAEHSVDNGYIFNYKTKSSWKRNFMKVFGSDDKNNFVPFVINYN